MVSTKKVFEVTWVCRPLKSMFHLSTSSAFGYCSTYLLMRHTRHYSLVTVCFVLSPCSCIYGHFSLPLSIPLFTLSPQCVALIEGWKASFIFWQHQMMKGLWSVFTPAGGAQALATWDTSISHFFMLHPRSLFFFPFPDSFWSQNLRRHETQTISDCGMTSTYCEVGCK